MPTFEYEATLDNDEYLKALREINDSMKKVATNGERAFDRVQKSSKRSGINIGVVSGVVGSLVTQFIDLGIKAAAVFADVAKGAVNLNLEAENLGIALTAVFKGNEKAAQRFITLSKEAAISIGANVQEFQGLAKGILPDVGDTQKTLELLKQATLLGQDAGQAIGGVRIALEEALASGGGAQGLMSLQRRLNLSPESIKRIQALNEEMKLSDAILQVLNERVERAGISAALFGDTLSSKLSAAQAEAVALQASFGLPIFEQLKIQIDSVLGAFQENEEDITRVATAFGDVAAAVIEIVGTGLTDLINNIDFDEVEGLGDDFADLVDSAKLLADVLLDPNLANNLISGARTLIQLLDRALVTAAQLSAIIKAEQARNKAERQVLGIEGTIAENVIGEAGARAAAAVVQPELIEEADVAGQRAFEEAIKDSLTAFERYDEELEKNAELTERRKTAQEEGTDADLAAAEALLQQQRALEELAQLEEKALTAQEKIDEAREKATLESEGRRTSILIDQERKRLDVIESNARERAKIERSNQDDISDINLEFARDLENLALKAGNTADKATVEAGRKRIEIERNLAKQRVGIEEDFQQTLNNIRASFEASAEEAERANDVQAFLAAQRRRARELSDAEQARQDSLQGAKAAAKEERDDVTLQLQQRTEEAQVQADERLAILELELRRSFEDQQIAHERELREQSIKEQQMRDTRLEANRRELDDLDQQTATRLAKVEDALSKELELIAAFEKAKADIRISESERNERTDRPRTQTNRIFPSSGSSSTLGLTPFQHGGRFRKGQGLLVGERGPEALVPDFSGFVIPNKLLAQLPPSMPITNTSQTNVDNRSQDLHLTPDMATDPVFLASMRNIAREEIVNSRRA